MKIQTRLETLNARYDRLIDLNSRKHFTSNERCGQYLTVLLNIKKEKMAIWSTNHSLTRKQLYNLTNPL